ncbi:hypothetical protein EJ02DRAFT_67895 [Clathrospora elynae]|uniref:Uncharacterized protein n=1 Tax=Clathrospora elynae TaxID=706981 RepID=A0A6A5SWS2_9PLEO|nr:hypothetical protein EJ02DRAFT_67895 [Clathrospora elynae]
MAAYSVILTPVSSWYPTVPRPHALASKKGNCGELNRIPRVAPAQSLLRRLRRCGSNSETTLERQAMDWRGCIVSRRLRHEALLAMRFLQTDDMRERLPSTRVATTSLFISSALKALLRTTVPSDGDSSGFRDAAGRRRRPKLLQRRQDGGREPWIRV